MDVELTATATHNFFCPQIAPKMVLLEYTVQNMTNLDLVISCEFCGDDGGTQQRLSTSILDFPS
jgi:hypothetical protein